ncbi:hypothetical protein BZG36_00238 [Bifiguratus adelaidae]|uniref:Putative 5'-nucleotidase C-terminal domain-containing protein n=1 Tax=Bifiguratus adelaidae TaxID=1938954 RepID=A0A261Y8E1_9FUNG|nr:hypothetical protein BZG36_00238 [Bifiguratus adelaidae]
MLFSAIVAFACASLTSAAPLEKRQQPGVPTTPTLDLRPLHWGDVNFIHTTDTHGWLEGHLKEENYNADLGDFYSFVVNMKKLSSHYKKDLFVVDTGDTHDVNNITKDIYNNFAPKWHGRYLTSNVYIKDATSNKTVPIGEKYTYFEGHFGTKVLAFGFLYDFTGNGNLSVVTKVESEVNQTWFKDALHQHQPDIIAVIGHVPIRQAEFAVVYKAIRIVYPYMPIAFLGGHSHIRDFKVFDNWAGGIESGRYLETIGWFSIDGVKSNAHRHVKQDWKTHNPPANLTFSRRYLDTNRETYIFHSELKDAKHFDSQKGVDLTKTITEERKLLNTSFVYGCAPHDYYLNRVPATNDYSIYSLITNEILPKVVVNASRPNPATVIINSGSQRFDLFKGPFTVDDTYIVSPFTDHFKYVTAPFSSASKVLAQLNNGKYNKRDVIPTGAVLPNEITFRNFAFHNITNATLTPGYTTTGDLGTDGDDTKHSSIPYVNQPEYVASALPTNATADTPIDVVYLDYFESSVISVLQSIDGKNYTGGYYRSDLMTTNTMYPPFAEKYWSKNC